MPIGWAIVVVVQWLAIVFLAVIVLGTLRRVVPNPEQADERPLLRIGKQQGPALGSKLPAFTAREGNAEIVTADLLRGRRSVLLFLSADCGPCLNLARELGTSEPDPELSGSLAVVTEPAGVSTLRLPDWLRVLTMPDAECAQVLDVRGRPFAITVDADGVVTEKRMVNTVAQLTELAASAPPSAAALSASNGATA